MKALLPDTNVLSELFRANAKVRSLLRSAERILITPVVEGELLGGFRAGNRLEKNLAEWSEFLDEPFVERLLISSDTANRYSRIWAQLRRSGTPIPSNDMWIAAQAGESGGELLSYDAHFACVQGLVWKHLT